MEELVNKIKSLSQGMLTDMYQSCKQKTGKAAGVRARKASLELEKMLKEYRKVSLEAAKK